MTSPPSDSHQRTQRLDSRRDSPSQTPRRPRLPNRTHHQRTHAPSQSSGHKLARRSTVIRAQQCRLLPSPDDFISGTQQTREPLGTPHQNGNPPHQTGTALGNPPLEPLLGMGTTPLLRSSRGEPAPSHRSTQQELLDQDNLW
jgi:hypothetical protein